MSALYTPLRPPVQQRTGEFFYPDLLKKLMDTIIYHNSESMPGTDHTMMPVT